MIYFKKKSLIKKSIISIKRKFQENNYFKFSFSKGVFAFLFVFTLFLYCTYLFLLPRYLNEATVEKVINDFVLKNSKLSLDVSNFKISPDYKFDINLKANYIKLKYPNKTDFLSIEKLNTDISLLSLLQGYLDLNKIKTEKIQINTDFTKQNRYSCFNYFDINSKNKNSKLKIRNINLENNNFLLKIHDENINKNFYIKADKLKISSSDFKKPILITTQGSILSNYKISDFNLNLSIKTNPNSIGKFKEKVANLNYNPLYYADSYKFYSNSNIDIKINPLNKKSGISGFIALQDLSFSINDLKLPKNNILLTFKNNQIHTISDFNLVKNQQIKVNSTLSLDKNKLIEAKLNSNEINLCDLREILNIAEKIFNLKFNLDNIAFFGTANLNLYLRSNFKSLTSNGKLEIKNAKIQDKKTGLVIKEINSNVNFANNTIDILNTSAFINEAKFNLSGKIDNKTNLNLKINSDTINIAQVLNLIKNLPLTSTFAPKLKEYDFKNGYLKINSTINGTLKNPILKSDSKLNNLKVYLKKYNKTIYVPEFKFNLFENHILIPQTKILLENTPLLIDGQIKNYKTTQAETVLSIKGEFFKELLSINNSSVNLNSTIKIKQDKLLIDSFNLSNSIFAQGKILNLSSNPTLNNIEFFTNEKVGIKLLKHQFNSDIYGKITLNNTIKNPNIIGKINLSNINLNNKNLKIEDSAIDIRNTTFHAGIPSISMPDLTLNAIAFNGNIKNNILNIENLTAQTLNGNIKGNININLNNQKTSAKIALQELNIRFLSNKLKEYSIATSGKLSADIDANLNTLKTSEILNNLLCHINFQIENGELSHFAKLERFLQAGNILSQSILKLSLNSILSTITKQNTGDFKTIKGDINIQNSSAAINYITTQGSNMSLFITGIANLEAQSVNTKVLGRIPHAIVNTMGNFGKFSLSQQIDKSGGVVTQTTLEKKLSTTIPKEDFEKIPNLAYNISNPTREFIVLINGLVDQINSIKDFKWIIKE